VIKALVCSGYQIIWIIGFKIKDLNFFLKLLIQKICGVIVYVNSDGKLWMFDYMVFLRKAATGVHLSPPREAGLLTSCFTVNHFYCKEVK
jgi:hypothetical protein